MTFAQLALANVRGSLTRYAAFVLSSTFSVLLFYLYAQFVFHPDLASGYLYGGSTTRSVLTVCMVLVVVFAFFFVLYSSGAFLRARNQEFGLLTLMGTTRRQLRRLIWLENTILSLASIAAGIGLGILLSRLFLMAIARVLLLEEPLRFSVVPQALLLTAGGFFLLFQFVTLASSLFVGRRRIIDLLGEARKPRLTPRSSVALALLGLMLVAGGYGVAIWAEAAMVVVVFVPVVAVVVVGTYLLFTHGSLFVLKRLQRPEAGYLSGTRMLVVSQLVFRLRDNARLLATIAALSAVVLSAAGSFYVITRTIASESELRFPQPLAVFEPSAGRGHLTAPEALTLLEQHGVEPELHASIDIRQYDANTVGGGSEPVVLVPRSSYDALVAAVAESGGRIPSAPRDPFAAPGTPEAEVSRPRRLLVEEAGVTFAREGSGSGILAEPVDSPVSQVPALWADWYAVPDADFAALPASSATSSGTVTIFDWPGSQRLTEASMALGNAIQEAATPEFDHLVANRLGMATMTRQTLGLSMFAGVFVSLLFFIGAGSLIYFKLFTELPDDRRLFTRLRRIGITRGETGRTVTAQIALVFLLPFAVGGVHALVALNSLGTMLLVNVVGYSLVVIALFGLVQLVFFALTRWTYLRALRVRA